MLQLPNTRGSCYYFGQWTMRSTKNKKNKRYYLTFICSFRIVWIYLYIFHFYSIFKFLFIKKLFPSSMLLWHLFLKLYFIDYAITVVLIFPPAPLHPAPPLPQAIPPPLFMSMVMCINSLAAPFSILSITSPCLFCNYLFVLLNPFAS